VIGAEFIKALRARRRYVVNAVAAHHEEVKARDGLRRTRDPRADTVSAVGAGRARARTSMTSYISSAWARLVRNSRSRSRACSRVCDPGRRRDPRGRLANEVTDDRAREIAKDGNFASASRTSCSIRARSKITVHHRREAGFTETESVGKIEKARNRERWETEFNPA